MDIIKLTAWDFLVVGSVLIVVYLIAKELIKLGTAYFFKKGIETDYVTVISCKSNRDLCRGNSDILVMKRAISLMIEYNNDIPIEKRAEIRDGLIT